MKVGIGSPDQREIDVIGFHVHENYDDWTLENDICMLDLAEDADFSSDFIDAINIPDEDQEYPSGQTCTIAGIGLKMNVTTVSDEECRDVYTQDDIFDSMICVESESRCYIHFCQDVDGEALMCGSGLDGIILWGFGCYMGLPSVYIQTSFFVSWINAHMS